MNLSEREMTKKSGKSTKKCDYGAVSTHPKRLDTLVNLDHCIFFLQCQLTACGINVVPHRVPNGRWNSCFFKHLLKFVDDIRTTSFENFATRPKSGIVWYEVYMSKTVFHEISQFIGVLKPVRIPRNHDVFIKDTLVGSSHVVVES